MVGSSRDFCCSLPLARRIGGWRRAATSLPGPRRHSGSFGDGEVQVLVRRRVAASRSAGVAGQVALGRVDSSWSRALRWDRGVLRTRGEARTSRVSAVTSHEVMGCQSKCERGPTRLRPLAGGSAQIIRLGTVRMSCRLRPKVRILLFAAIFAKPQDDINIQALRNAVRRGWSGGRRNHVARAKARTILYSSSNAARARLKDAQCTLLGNGKRTT